MLFFVSTVEDMLFFVFTVEDMLFFVSTVEDMLLFVPTVEDMLFFVSTVEPKRSSNIPVMTLTCDTIGNWGGGIKNGLTNFTLLY